MGATRWEYRFRFLIHALVYTLGFWAPWTRYLPGLSLSSKSTWLVASAELARQGWLTFSAAVYGLLALALVLTGLGAMFRTWGAAFIGSGIVKSESMHGGTLLADGPYRRTRNPLYLGTILHTAGVAALMPPSGALLALAVLWLFQFRLALAEEPFLAARFGAAYGQYRQQVPRFLPSSRPLVPSGGRVPSWGQALTGELYFVGVFLTLLAVGWRFNLTLVFQGILISLGLGIVVRALLPATPVEVKS